MIYRVILLALACSSVHMVVADVLPSSGNLEASFFGHSSSESTLMFHLSPENTTSGFSDNKDDKRKSSSSSALDLSIISAEGGFFSHQKQGRMNPLSEDSYGEFEFDSSQIPCLHRC